MKKVETNQYDFNKSYSIPWVFSNGFIIYGPGPRTTIEQGHESNCLVSIQYDSKKNYLSNFFRPQSLYLGNKRNLYPPYRQKNLKKRFHIVC